MQSTLLFNQGREPRLKGCFFTGLRKVGGRLFLAQVRVWGNLCRLTSKTSIFKEGVCTTCRLGLAQVKKSAHRREL